MSKLGKGQSSLDTYPAMEASGMVEKSVYSWAPDASDSRGIGVDRDFDVLSLPEVGDRFGRRMVASDDVEEGSSSIADKHVSGV